MSPPTYFFVIHSGIEHLTSADWSFELQARWSVGTTEVHRGADGEFFVLVYLSNDYAGVFDRPGWSGGERIVTYADGFTRAAVHLVRVPYSDFASIKSRRTLNETVHEIVRVVPGDTASM